MTVPVQFSRRVIDGSGWANPLTHEFLLENATDLTVWADDVELVLGVDYTVSGIGNAAGYGVTITTPSNWSPDCWALEVDYPINQPSDIDQGGQFGQRFEAALDRIARGVQSLDGRVRRAFRVRPTAPLDMDLTAPLPEPGKVLGWSADGNMVNLTTLPEGSPLSSLGAALIIAAGPGEVFGLLGQPLTPNTIPVDNAAGISRQQKTFPEVRTLLGTTVAHLRTFFDLAVTLVGDGVTDDTAAFVAALNTAKALGIRQIISSNPSHRYKIVEAELPGSFDFYMNGAGFYAEYNGRYANTCATILKTSTEANAYSVRIFGALIDGRNTGGNASGAGGHPLLDFTGGEIEIADSWLVRGANRGGAIDPATQNYMDSMQGEFQFRNCTRVRLHNNKVGVMPDGSVGGSPGEVIHVLCNKTNSLQKTLVEIEKNVFSKSRSDSLGNDWSNSSVVVYGCSKGSYIHDNEFRQHMKSAVNWFGPGSIGRNRFAGVSGSQAIDCDEAGSFGIDQLRIYDNLIQNVIGGYAIRVSARACVIEGNDINRCQNGIYVEVQGATPSKFTNLGCNAARSMYNVYLRNNTGNGNEVPDGTGATVVNTFIKIKGLSSTAPATVCVEGVGPQLRADGGNFPSANEEYGIDCENCYLFLTGTFSHGATALVRMKGYAKFKAREASFILINAGRLVIFDAATIRDIVFEDVETTQSNFTGKHVEFLNTPTLQGRMYRTRAGDINVTDTGIAYTNNYTAMGTT